MACLLGSVGVATAQDLSGAARQLASEDTAEVLTGIERIGNSSEPAALEILEALADRRLHVSSTTAVVELDGTFTDPVSGQAGKPAADSKVPVVNNKIRRVLKRALAQQQLRSEDEEVRFTAAKTLSEGASPATVEAARAALARESSSDVKELLRLAIARVDLTSEDAARRLSAVTILGDIGDPATKPTLKAMVMARGDGSYTETSADVRAAALTALDSIARKEMISRVMRDLFYGLSLGSVLLLAALGLAITFGLMGVINMAHGEMLMLGSYATYFVQSQFQKHASDSMDWYLVAAVPVAFIVTFLVGVLLERTVIRFLYGRPLETLLATWGVSLILIQTVRLIFGAANVAVANPSWLSGGYDLAPGVVLPNARIAVILFTVVVVTFVWWLLNRTRLGLNVRAITQNRSMARCMGIRTSRVDMMTFGFGSGVAGLGGVALSQIGNVGPELGQGYIVDSFMVVVVGGVGNVLGTVVAAIGLGTVNKVLEPLSGAVLGKILVLGFIILFIQRRPQGLFALKGRAAEA